MIEDEKKRKKKVIWIVNHANPVHYLRECPHEHVDIVGVHTSVLAHTPTRRTQGADRMGLIHVYIGLVFLAYTVRTSGETEGIKFSGVFKYDS